MSIECFLLACNNILTRSDSCASSPHLPPSKLMTFRYYKSRPLWGPTGVSGYPQEHQTTCSTMSSPSGIVRRCGEWIRSTYHWVTGEVVTTTSNRVRWDRDDSDSESGQDQDRLERHRNVDASFKGFEGTSRRAACTGSSSCVRDPYITRGGRVLVVNGDFFVVHGHGAAGRRHDYKTTPRFLRENGGPPRCRHHKIWRGRRRYAPVRHPKGECDNACSAACLRTPRTNTVNRKWDT